MAAFLSAACTCAQTPSAPAEKLSQGYIYVHTARNNPAFIKNGTKLSVKKQDLIAANGLTVETVDGQCVTLILSNRTAIYVQGKAKFTIENFEQVAPFVSPINDEYEAEHSQLRMSVDYGNIYMSMLVPRPASRTLIKTKLGVIEPKTTAMCIFCGADASKFAILNGQAVFCGLDNKRDFIQRGQIGIVEEIESKKMYPLKIEPMNTIDEEKYIKELDLCKLAIQSVEFKFDKDGKISAARLVPKDFFLKKYNID